VNLFPLSELQEPQSNEKRLPFAVKITRDLLTGTKLFTNNTQMLRAGFALPGDCDEEFENLETFTKAGKGDKIKGKFGLPPEALAMGLSGMEQAAMKSVRIYYHRDMSTFPNKDEDL